MWFFDGEIRLLGTVDANGRIAVKINFLEVNAREEVEARIGSTETLDCRTVLLSNRTAIHPPTEIIEIPFNITDTSKYYYLDLFMITGGKLFDTSNTTGGGTYLTITPLQGGGLATGGPGGTPGTQWISSGANIYFPNSIGVGGINPGYTLDAGTGTTNTATLITGNVYSPGTNVIINSNLSVTGNTISAQYASFNNFSGYRNKIGRAHV